MDKSSSSADKEQPSPVVVETPSDVPAPNPEPSAEPSPTLLPGLPLKDAPPPPDYGPHAQGSCGRYERILTSSFGLALH